MFSQVTPHSGRTSVFTHQRIRQTLEMELLRWKLIEAVLCPSENFRPKVLWIWQLKILVIWQILLTLLPLLPPLLQVEVLYSKVWFSLKSEKDCDYVTQTILQKTPCRCSSKYLFIYAEFIYKLTKVTKKSAKVIVPCYTFTAQWIEKLSEVLGEISGPHL